MLPLVDGFLFLLFNCQETSQQRDSSVDSMRKSSSKHCWNTKMLQTGTFFSFLLSLVFCFVLFIRLLVSCRFHIFFWFWRCLSSRWSGQARVVEEAWTHGSQLEDAVFCARSKPT